MERVFTCMPFIDGFWQQDLFCKVRAVTAAQAREKASKLNPNAVKWFVKIV